MTYKSSSRLWNPAMFLSLRALSVGLLSFVMTVNIAAAGEPPAAVIAKAAATILVPKHPKRDGILTVRDNTLYVQCINRPDVATWRCEAAGLEGEPWLRNVLTMERQDRLIARGFKPDTATGNFVRSFARSTTPATLAKTILAVLTDIYGADIGEIDAITDWLPAAPCHPRMISGHDFGGSIKTPKWGHEKDVAAGCDILTNTNGLNLDDFKTPAPGAPSSGEIDLAARYAAAMAPQLERLESGQKHIWAVFTAGIPYIQCKFDSEDNAFYCEAASDDASGAPLARILTPDRRQKLIDAGFEPPGKVVNFRRFYPLAQYDEVAVAKALLAVLHDAYGYGGAPALRLHTEKGDAGAL